MPTRVAVLRSVQAYVQSILVTHLQTYLDAVAADSGLTSGSDGLLAGEYTAPPATAVINDPTDRPIGEDEWIAVWCRRINAPSSRGIGSSCRQARVDVRVCAQFREPVRENYDRRRGHYADAITQLLIDHVATPNNSAGISLLATTPVADLDTASVRKRLGLIRPNRNPIDQVDEAICVDIQVEARYG